MFTGGFSQGILSGLQATRDNAAQDTDLAYKKQLMAMQAIALENARSQQAKSQQWDQMAGYEDAMPPAPQPPAPGQASVPMQQAPQGPPQGQPQGQAPGGVPPGLLNGMGMQGPPPGPPPQQMAPPQGAPMPPGQPMPQQQPAPPIPPYQSMQSLQQRQQAAPQPTPAPMAPPPVGGAPAGGGMPAPGSMQNASPFQNADVTPEQASQAAAAQIMKLATGPDSYTVMKQNVMQHLIANGVPPQQADQQAAQYLANSPAAQTKLKAMEAQRQEALQITEKAQSAADAAYKAVLLKQSQAETERRDTNTAAYQKGELDVQRGNLGVAQGRLGLERQKFAKESAGGAGGSKNQSDADAAMVLEGAPRTAVVGGMGKESTARWQAAKAAAVESLMKEKNMTAAQAGSYIANKELEYKARGGALNAIEKRASGIEYTTEQIKNNIGTMNSVLDKVAAKGGAQILNKPLNKVREALSDEDRGVLDLVTRQVGMEYERQLQGGQLSVAQLHAGAAEDAQRLLNQDMTPAEIRAKLPIMIKEIEGGSRAAATVKGNLMGGQGGASGGIPAGWSIKEVK